MPLHTRFFLRRSTGWMTPFGICGVNPVTATASAAAGAKATPDPRAFHPRQGATAQFAASRKVRTPAAGTTPISLAGAAAVQAAVAACARVQAPRPVAVAAAAARGFWLAPPAWQPSPD